MTKRPKGVTRREFIELAAVGTAGVTTVGLGTSSAFAATPKRGGTLNCGMPFLIQNPDPHRRTGTWARQFMALSWEGLVTPTSVGERMRITREKGPDAVPEVQPMLADSWEIEKNGARYVFHLKKGVKFHHGKELDSGDVKWSWERIKDPAHRSTARAILTQFLDTVETPDKYTVVANLSRPYAAFLIGNAWCNTCILPKDSIPQGAIWGETPTFKPDRVAPPGTGPFEVAEYQQKHQAVFKRHENYRVPGLPYLDKVVYKIISKPSPRTMALRAANIDYANGLESNWAGNILKGKMDKIEQPIHLKEEKLIVWAHQYGGTHALYPNSHDKLGNSPFRDVRVRQALDLCIDRYKLCKVLYGDLMIPKYQGFHPAISPWGFKDIKPKPPNIEKAKQLLKEAGYPNGVDVDFYVTPTWGKQDVMAQIVQQMAKPAGFRMKIIPQVGLQYWGHIRARNYHIMVYGLMGEDPMNFYYYYLHGRPEKPWDGYGILGAKDEIMNQLLDDMAGEINPKKRKAKFKKVVLRSNELGYFIPYGEPITVNGWNEKLKNFKPWNYYFPEEGFREVWIDT
ncbi:MAG: ABC transporter substrate-binding protein [Deltaproteobacteria bacterium]|nr:ABC transporter substrate-binding protein [Deltaproteobacteria bacterium]MBW2051125.1 ABC transporter substrate-binding protein [Deltaproteobacteria bacterium]MBW2322860.1 ABC transporter substrate-binding protein [Deltaproteobacteria bacterium]